MTSFISLSPSLFLQPLSLDAVAGAHSLTIDPFVVSSEDLLTASSFSMSDRLVENSRAILDVARSFGEVVTSTSLSNSRWAILSRKIHNAETEVDPYLRNPDGVTNCAIRHSHENIAWDMEHDFGENNHLEILPLNVEIALDLLKAKTYLLMALYAIGGMPIQGRRHHEWGSISSTLVYASAHFSLAGEGLERANLLMGAMRCYANAARLSEISSLRYHRLQEQNNSNPFHACEHRLLWGYMHAAVLAREQEERKLVLQYVLEAVDAYLQRGWDDQNFPSTGIFSRPDLFSSRLTMRLTMKSSPYSRMANLLRETQTWFKKQITTENPPTLAEQELLITITRTVTILEKRK